MNREKGFGVLGDVEFVAKILPTKEYVVPGCVLKNGYIGD